MSLRGRLARVVGVAMLCSFGSATQAEDGEFDPFADAILLATSDYLASASQFSVHAEGTFEEVLRFGQKVELSRSADVMVRRPDSQAARARPRGYRDTDTFITMIYLIAAPLGNLLDSI